MTTAAETTVTEQTAAERAARGREQLRAVDEQLATVRETVDSVAGELAALVATVRRREAEQTAAEAALEAADKALLAARAAALLDARPDAAKESIATLEAHRAHRAQAARDAQTATGAARRALASESALIDRKLLAAKERVSELEQLRKAVEVATMAAHASAGRERTQELGARHKELLERLQASWEAYTAADAALWQFYAGVPGELSAWPDLARQPLEEQIHGRPVTPARAVITTFLRYLDVLERHGGFMGRLMIRQGHSIAETFRWLDSDTVEDLMLRKGGPSVSRLAQIRKACDRLLSVYG